MKFETQKDPDLAPKLCGTFGASCFGGNFPEI